ncbi:MAG: elongation factor G [Armatimonadetes bacterium]|nr:elongation factor G [Armatimonadota bacterium]
MAQTADIRNIALIGHRGAGKTSLTEALLHAAGATNRMGSVQGGNAVTDFDDEERARQLSISGAVASFEYKGKRINLLDTPGYADFLGETYGALRVADCAVLVVHAESGVEVETEKTFAYAQEFGLPVIAVINHADAERADVERVIDQLSSKLGARVAIVGLPWGKGASLEGVVDLAQNAAFPGGQTKTAQAAPIPADLAGQAEELRGTMVEFAAENDEGLMEKFFEGESLSADELLAGLKMGVATGLVPVTVTSATRNIGTLPLLDLLLGLAPSPADRPAVKGLRPHSQDEVERAPDAKAPFSAYCFKCVLGEGRRISLIRVLSGSASAGMQVLNSTKGEKERLGTFGVMRGGELKDVTSLVAGDIVGVVKIDASAGDTLCDDSAPVVYPSTKYPTPLMSLAIQAKSRGDDEKVGAGMSALRDEDPSMRFARNPETEQQVLSGMGDMHLQVILSKLKNRFKVEVETSKPKIAYKETVRSRAESQGRYKKQTGGSGQFGDVHMRLEPLPRGSGVEFSDEIFGGSVPKQYIPSAEKGSRARLAEGLIAGFPVVDTKITLYDGSYHNVDSSDIAFQLAARIAMEACAQKAGVVLLEPIMDVYVSVPDDYVGDIMGDLPRRRGTVMGSTGEGNLQTIQAQVPAAELATYATDLRSMTQGRGSFRIEFNRYEEVPGDLQQKIVAERAAEMAEARK